jgi:hypothetical protein
LAGDLDTAVVGQLPAANLRLSDSFEPQILQRIAWLITNEEVRRSDLKIAFRVAHRPKRLFEANHKSCASLNI